MTAERWQVVKRILEEALARDPSLRSAHVAAACAGDEGLRRDVESFLADEQSDEFLERPALGRAPRVPDSALRATVTTKPGQVDNVRPVDLAPYTKLVVSTRRSRYELIAVAPLDREFLVKGGRRFPETTRARLCHAEHQADEGNDCQCFADHLKFARRIRSSVVRSAP